MAESILTTALTAKFPDKLPPWVDPFLKAVRRIEIVEKREQDGTIATSDNKPKRKGKKKPSKKPKASRKGKAKQDVEEETDDEDDLGDHVEDEVMMRSAEEYLETVGVVISMTTDPVAILNIMGSAS